MSVGIFPVSRLLDSAPLGHRGDVDSEEVPCLPVLKITQYVLTGSENSLLYLIFQPLTRTRL